MDLLHSLLTLLASIICLVLFRQMSWIRNAINGSSNGAGETLPEATGSWPIIGHLHLLSGSQLPHKLLGLMADSFGPIFTIKLGVHRVLVASNSEMAKECLMNNDRFISSRPKAMVSELMGNNYANVALAPYGPYWREIRKIIVLELMSPRRLQMLAHLRVSEVKSSMKDMYKTWILNKGSSETVRIDMKQWFNNMVLNMVVRMVFGNRFSLNNKINEDQFKKAIRRFAELLGAFVPSDAIPGLRWLDIGGYEKKMKKTAKEMNDVIDKLLEEHKKKMNSSFTQEIDESKDEVFMTTLLFRVKEELNEDLRGFSSDEIVKATCLAILSASTDTTTVTLTWALALLVNNPLVLRKAQQELESQAIIKETMRLYPAIPLPVPRESTQDCIVGGYTVPKETRLFVNIWKIHHDPNIWTNPFEFQPERFLTSAKDIDVKGQHFELIPFGSGRRICLGMNFALEAVQLILASIIHGFEFANPSNKQIDMTGSPGLSNLKATPLELLVLPRLLPHLYRVVHLELSYI